MIVTIGSDGEAVRVRVGMASSWTEYDASQRRGSGVGGQGIGGTSSLSTKKIRSGGGSSSAASSSGKHGTGGKRKGRTAAPPTGIDALYVDAPPGIDTRLQFQWIRPHPFSAILAAAASAPQSGGSSTGAASAISPQIVEAARLVEHYQQAKADANGANDDSEKKDSSLHSDKSKKRKLPKVDLGCINATVELTSLFEPPLLSEWGTPGVNMNTSYDDKNDEEESFDDSDSDESYVHRANTSNKNNDDKSKETSAAEQIESALGKLVQCAAATKGATQVDESTKQIFHNTTGASLLECLPSRMLLQKVQDAASTAADGASYLQIGVTTLTLLADIAQAESMGRHILSVLAPVLLSSPSASCTSMGKERNYFATSVELLAKALIHRCGLGELSKADLLKLAESGELGRSEEPSEFMDLLLIALGKAYHE